MTTHASPAIDLLTSILALREIRRGLDDDSWWDYCIDNLPGIPVDRVDRILDLSEERN